MPVDPAAPIQPTHVLQVPYQHLRLQNAHILASPRAASHYIAPSNVEGSKRAKLPALGLVACRDVRRHCMMSSTSAHMQTRLLERNSPLQRFQASTHHCTPPISQARHGKVLQQIGPRMVAGFVQSSSFVPLRLMEAKIGQVTQKMTGLAGPEIRRPWRCKTSSETLQT